MVIVATAPVFVGGVLTGAALDRFERRRFLALVNAVLGRPSCRFRSRP